MEQIIESSVAVAELWELGVETIDRPRDKRIFCPSLKWVGEFSAFLRHNAKPWMMEKYDCDDFSIWGVHEATNALVAADKIKNCGHSVCYAEFRIETSFLGVQGPGLHANLLIRTHDAGWYFVEPQNGFYEKIKTNAPNYSTPYWVWL